MEEAHQSNSSEDRRKAVPDVCTSGPQGVDAFVVCDDDGAVDDVEEDEAKMLDTISSTGKIPSGDSERMERQWRRARRPMTTRRRTTMSWR
jgi:hypothetical protein